MSALSYPVSITYGEALRIVGGLCSRSLPLKADQVAFYAILGKWITKIPASPDCIGEELIAKAFELYQQESPAFYETELVRVVKHCLCDEQDIREKIASVIFKQAINRLILHVEQKSQNWTAKHLFENANRKKMILEIFNLYSQPEANLCLTPLMATLVLNNGVNDKHHDFLEKVMMPSQLDSMPKELHADNALKNWLIQYDATVYDPESLEQQQITWLKSPSVAP